MKHEHNGRRPAPRYLLAGLVIGMAVTGALLVLAIPPFFSSEGGDPMAAGLLAVGFVVFTVAARIVRPGVMD